GQTTTNTYNPRNELIQVNDGQVSEYKYNAEGKRVQKITDTTTNFVYDGDNILLELDDQNNQVATNTYGLSLIKRTTDKEGYYLYNGHGDVTKIVDNTNNILNSYVYDEFGKILSETETFNNPYKYAGYYYDKETKTYYLQSRYYNPEIQRFISEDAFRGNIDDPLSLNLYTYCSNNPLIYVDPSGHFWEEIAAGFKYVGERTVATVHAGAEFAYDTVKGTAELAWNLGETLGNEIGFIGNEVGYNFGLMGREQYLNNREQRLNIISKNMDMYIQMPGNMVTGIVDNFKTTFDKENFLNYWNPNTSYSELKDYSKSVIQTGVTIYGGVKIGQAAYNKVTSIVKNIQNSKLVTSTVNPLSKIDDYVDLTGHRKAHILNRHRAGVGKSGKTEFPSSWSDNRILNNISDVATDPKSITGIGKYNSPYSMGIRDGIQIRVDFYPSGHPTYSGMISTAYPINVPTNPF
ncbi:MAG: repeat-containing protein, partial [Clostridia bacterium]|nr:repeat-containing protein [Clostridia bacterium]